MHLAAPILASEEKNGCILEVNDPQNRLSQQKISVTWQSWATLDAILSQTSQLCYFPFSLSLQPFSYGQKTKEKARSLA